MHSVRDCHCYQQINILYFLNNSDNCSANLTSVIYSRYMYIDMVAIKPDTLLTHVEEFNDEIKFQTEGTNHCCKSTAQTNNLYYQSKTRYKKISQVIARQ